ncbi:MAG: DNA repair protein RecO [bacterium]|nr:DNA repair protein RecO [bacterium]
MRSLSAEALLLDAINLHERDRIVSFLTARWGKKRGVARGARAKYSRFAGQLQPLAKVAVTWFEKEGRDLVRISDVELVRPASGLQSDLEGILLGSYLAEHMMEFAQENEDSEKPFRLLDSTLEALLEGCDRNLAARYFEIWVLRLNGIFPVPHECPLCGSPIADSAAFIESEAAVVCRQCGGGASRQRIGGPELDFLRRSARENLEQLSERPPAVGTLERIEGLCASVRRGFLQSELKSYRVMKRTLADV